MNNLFKNLEKSLDEEYKKFKENMFETLEKNKVNVELYEKRLPRWFANNLKNFKPCKFEDFGEADYYQEL